MKKNSSLRTIKTSYTPSLAYLPPYQKPSSPVYKKTPTIDLFTTRPPSEKPVDNFPASTKYSSYTPFLQKKGLSVKKGVNNENVSKVNLNDIPNTNSGSPGYNTLKTKINDLEGRLMEIKKNFESSFISKKNKADRSNLKNNKENQPFQITSKEKPSKTKLVLQYTGKTNQESYKTAVELTNRPVTSKSKTNISKITSIKHIQKEDLFPKYKQTPTSTEKTDSKQADKSANSSNPLQQYVTTFTCEPRNNTLIQCTSESNLFKIKEDQKQHPRHNRYYISQIISAFLASKPSTFDQLCRNHLITSMDILSYIKSSNKQVPQNVSVRPLQKATRQTIIFDLDETLIHCNENTNIPFDVSLPIKFPNNTIIKAGINIRPYAQECLRELSRYFQLIVFTASHECYANVIIDYLDPDRDLISARYFRDSCFRTEEGFYVKDLRVVDRDLRNVLLVDNAAYSYCFQLDNGVPIIPFYDNKADLELKSLVSYLKEFVGIKDMRVKNGRQMRFGDYHNFKDPALLIKKLYD